VVVSAGLRVPSSTRLLADELGEAAVEALGRAGQEGTDVRVIELREHAHPIADALLTGFAAGALRDAIDAVSSADALIVVSPTFSASYSGLFKSFFDLFESGSLQGIPTLLAATGGTERHSLALEHALRPLFVYLGASPVRTGVYAATSDFGGEGAGRLRARVRRAGNELAMAALNVPAAGAVVPGSGGRRPPDPLDDVVPFEQLLAAHAPPAPPLRETPAGGGEGEG
jgi:FMN reductase